MSSRVLRRAVVRAGLLSLLPLALLCSAPAISSAALTSYQQSFESMSPADPGALASDGWLVYGNVFDASMVYVYGYGPFPAPNNPPPAFSALATGQGGATQEAIQLSVFSDYENADHANNRWIESNVYQERTIDASNVGQTWYFDFDAKLGDLAGSTTASAFIKTLAPPTYALTNFLTAAMTTIPTTWSRYSISIPITADLVGQILQFGFLNTATNYQPSSVYYDNLTFQTTPTVGVSPVTDRGPGLQLRVHGNPALGGNTQVLVFDAPRPGRVTVRLFRVTGGLVATLVDRELPAGGHQATWSGLDDSGRPVAAGLYFAEVVAGGQREVARLQRLR